MDVERPLRIEPAGRRQLHRSIYTNPQLFELELKYIWESVWVYLGHESQLPVPGSFITTSIGRQPIILNRSNDGPVTGFINTCRHRGATLCRASKGVADIFQCPYHSWTYGADGRLIATKDERNGGYPPSFDKSELGLTPVPRLDAYRGFVFGCLNSDVEPLDEYLGDARAFIDLIVDQSPAGVEILKGSSTYTYPGNWKMQAENGVDGYHATTVHRSMMAVQRNRERIDLNGERPRPMNHATENRRTQGGYYDLGHGHTLIWSDWGNPDDRFNHRQFPEVAQRIGAARAQWALGRLRNVLFYPSMLLMDSASAQIRIIRPLAVDKTEITIFGVAPVGEPADQRRMRIRSYEDFFNASGLATPDDLAEFAACQTGFLGESSPWSDLSRGVGHEIEGGDAAAHELGIHPVTSSPWKEDEGIFVGQYRYWTELMSRASAEALT